MAAALAWPQANCPSLLWAAQSLGWLPSERCSCALRPLNSVCPNHLEPSMGLQR